MYGSLAVLPPSCFEVFKTICTMFLETAKLAAIASVSIGFWRDFLFWPLKNWSNGEKTRGGGGGGGEGKG